MLKMEIVMDREKLESNGYDFDKSIAIICNGLKEAGLIEELNEEGHIIYRGTDSNKDLAYMGLVVEQLLKQQWFKNACKQWLVLNNAHSKNGEFLIAGDWIAAAKEGGLW